MSAPAALTLHGHPGNASMIPHILLRELGVPFDWVHVDRAIDAHKSPEYLRLNPNGLIPVLVDSRGDAPIVLYETAAICLHLADTHPRAGLVPPLGTAARAHAYKWLAWMSTTMQPALMAYFYPERWVDDGDAAGAARVRARAEARAGELLALLDAHLGAPRTGAVGDERGGLGEGGKPGERDGRGGPWMLGDAFSLLDPYAFTLCRWTRGFARPARAWPALGPYLARMLERPAVARVLADEGLPKPWV